MGNLLFANQEDGFEADFRGRREAEHGKVSDDSRSDRVTSTTRRGTSCTDCDILRCRGKGGREGGREEV